MTIVEQLRTRKPALSVAELAKLLSMGTRTIYAGMKPGRIPSIRILGTVRLNPQQIAVWLVMDGAVLVALLSQRDLELPHRLGSHLVQESGVHRKDEFVQGATRI